MAPRNDKSEILVEPGMQLTVQGDIGGVMVAIEQRIPVLSFEGAINEHLDVMRRSWVRQKAQVEIAEKLVAVQIATELLEALPDEKDRTLKGMVEDHARLLASYRSAHQVSGRRGDYRPSQAEQQKTLEHEMNLATRARQFDDQKARYEQDIRIANMQIVRLRKLIDGELEAETPKMAAE